jgi:hypothetical protein
MSEIVKIMLIAVGRIEADGKIYNPGDPLECEEREALRLIGLDAARPTEPEQLTEPGPEQSHEDLLARIKAASTYEEVLALMPEEEPPVDIADAFEARLEELRG